MKVCITSESYPPAVSGVAVFTENLAKYLSGQGHGVVLIVPSEDRQYRVEKAGDITIYRLRSVRNPFRTGHRFTVDPLIAIARIIKKEQPDILHLQDPSGISLSAQRIGKKLKIPIIATNHFMLDYIFAYLYWLKPLHPLIKIFFGGYLRWFYNHADVVTCPTQFVVPYLENLGVTKPIRALSNGVNLDQFYAHFGNLAGRLKYNIPTNIPIVLYVGRLDIDKSVNDLLRAVASAKQQIRFHAVLCGDGKSIHELKALAKELNITNSTSFIGFVDQAYLPEVYQMADVFVTASTTETQSLTALEAMASALPIIAPKDTAIDELITDGKTGYKCQPHNPQSLADKIVKLLKDLKTTRQMGQNALQLVAKHESQKALNEFVELYRQYTK